MLFYAEKMTGVLELLQNIHRFMLVSISYNHHSIVRVAKSKMSHPSTHKVIVKTRRPTVAKLKL